MLGQIITDIKSFVSGKDLVVFAIALALSAQFQSTIRTAIDGLIMPFISKLTGATNLSSRSLQISPPTASTGAISIQWGKALESFILFCITLIIMVEIAKYLTVHFVESSSVKF
jgi:large-conductance mechanosensitive channel